MRMLARVEGMPLESLQSGVPWDWTSTGEYLDRLEGTLVPNAGFLVGHSAIRRAVMHDEAVGGPASPAQVEAMKQAAGRGACGGRARFLVLVVTHSQRPRREPGAVPAREP